MDHLYHFNENGVLTLSNDEVVNILIRKIKSDTNKYLSSDSVRIVSIVGRATRSQELGRTFKFKIHADKEEYSKTVYIKLCAKWHGLDAAKQEFETLQLLHDQFSRNDANLGVARPIAYYPELNAYAQESVGVLDFKRVLLKENSRYKKDDEIEELYSVLRLCARWLQTFHQITLSDKQVKFDYQSFVNCEDEDVDFSLLEKFCFKSQTRAAVRDCLSRLKAVDGVACPAAGFHFDYTPAHIFLDNGLYVIDILGLDKIIIYEDIGHFAAALATVNNFPFYPFYDYARAHQKLTKIFIDAYCQDNSQAGSQFYLLTNCYQLKYLTLWFGAQYLRVSSKVHPVVGKAYANHRLVKVFEPVILHTVNEIDRLLGKIE